MSDEFSNRSSEATFRKRWCGLKAAVVAMVCTTLMLTQASSAFAESTASYEYEKAQRDLNIIIPGASFALCENVENPAKCESNRAALIKSVLTLSRLRYTYFGYKSRLDKDQFLSFFQNEFSEILFCFRENCNSGLTLTDTAPAEAYKIWLSLGHYLQCRYVAYKSFAKTDLTNLPDAIGKENTVGRNLQVDRMAREICLGADFPQHLFSYIDEVHIIREGGKF